MTVRDSFSAIVDGDQLNDGFFVETVSVPIKLAILNKIRQLQDRSVDSSSEQDDIFAEAYVDTNGRLNTVNTTDSTAVLSSLVATNVESTNYTFAGGSTGSKTVIYTANVTGYVSRYRIRHSATSITVQVKNSSGDVIASKISTGSSGEYKEVFFDVSDYTEAIIPGTFYVGTIGTTTYDTNRAAYNGKYFSRTDLDSHMGISFYNPVEVEVHHDLPTGEISSTISSVVGSPLIEDWEDGADIQYKLTNATEDTGWINRNEISNFTAFTSEPTKLIVKLIPKSTNPTAGYPSIKGFGVYAQ